MRLVALEGLALPLVAVAAAPVALAQRAGSNIAHGPAASAARPGFCGCFSRCAGWVWWRWWRSRRRR